MGDVGKRRKVAAGESKTNEPETQELCSVDVSLLDFKRALPGSADRRNYEIQIFKQVRPRRVSKVIKDPIRIKFEF